MKRHGHLFEDAFSHNSLYQAWVVASRGKRAKRATLEFSRHLAANLDALHQEIHSGQYRPRAYQQFRVYEPKERIIFAPAFRDLVVQHAIYRLITPIFDVGFIDQSFACRKGKGTHKAADYAQQALRHSDPDSFTLKLDIKKFFYRIDRAILRQQIERKIKDRSFVDMMMVFTEYGDPLGIPIGNLLSQTYALIYLNPLDHFIKRELKAKRYCRYVDDFVLFGLTREQARECHVRIIKFLRDTLKLHLSRVTLSKTRRGLNFVGYRTWARLRFIRKHSLYTFVRAAKRSAVASLTACLGHATHTASFQHLLRILRDRYPRLIPSLPKRYQRQILPLGATA